jgi:hypothetical protein
MPETLDPFLFAIDAAFESDHEVLDHDDDLAPTLVEHLASSGQRRQRPPMRRSGRRVPASPQRQPH